MKQVEHGALLGTSGRDRGTAAALDQVLGELGFSPGKQAPSTNPWPRTGKDDGLEVVHLTPERGAWFCLGTTPQMARAITIRLAMRLKTPLQIFVATARFDDRSLECTVEDRMIRADGTSALGSFANELEASVGGKWKALCDAKPYFALTALIDAAIERWIPMTFEKRTVVWDSPPSLGDRRLDELALRIRMASRAQLTTVDARACMKVTTVDNATTMSFLTPDELALLESAVGKLFTR